jgi:hypothetical protein
MTRKPTLTEATMDRRSPDEIRAMAATYRMYLDGSLSRADGRPLPMRYHQAWELVRAGLV